jgi:hypothetical protein
MDRGGRTAGARLDALRQLEAAYAASRPDQPGAPPSEAGAAGYDRASAYGVDVAQPFGPWNTGGFGAARYPLSQPRWMSPAAPANTYGNDLWYALGVRMGFDPQALQRFAASLASSPPLSGLPHLHRRSALMMPGALFGRRPLSIYPTPGPSRRSRAESRSAADPTLRHRALLEARRLRRLNGPCRAIMS